MAKELIAANLAPACDSPAVGQIPVTVEEVFEALKYVACRTPINILDNCPPHMHWLLLAAVREGMKEK